MSGKVWVKAALVAVAGVAGAVGLMFVLLIGVWWSLGSEDYYSKPGPEIVRRTPEQFQALSEIAAQDTLGTLSPALELSDTGCTVDRYAPRSDGTLSKLSTVDRRYTARTRISASHRQELKDRIKAAWRLGGYQQETPIWTPSTPADRPEFLSAETSEGIRVTVALYSEPDGTITLTMSVSGSAIAWAPEYARPLSPVRPDVEDSYWSH
ncbi:hypothetical protein ABT093_30375 [Kitasatospora sp. NPDC002551]|uniref:hypothetical protein n=1 Tax=Kitasatospora sp. NPDC002551 TaxID=3154539 RepID=UPI00331FDC6B